MVASGRVIAAVAARPRAALLRASVVLLAVAAVSKLTTLAADAFVAARFGLSVDTDAYLIAIGLVGLFLAAPSETFRLAVVPLVGQYLREGDRRRAAGVVLLTLIVALALGAVTLAVLLGGLPWVVRAAAPGFESEGREKLGRLLVILAPAPALGLVMALFLGVLHSQLRFAVPAIVGIGLSAGVIGMGVLLGPTLGVSALAVGYVVGMAAVTAVLGWLARDLLAGRLTGAWRDARAHLRPFLRLALPTGLAISLVSAGAAVERAIASATGAGNVAALGFAIKLVTQAGIISQSIWTPLTPLLTASGASAEREGEPRLVLFSLKLVLLVLTLATVLVIALRKPIVGVLLERGAFTAADTEKTATLLALHSGSLLGEGLFMVSVAALLSWHDVATRVVASSLLLLSKVALAFALTPVVGVAGVAVAASVSSLVAGVYAVRALSARFTAADLRSFSELGVKTAVAGLVALAAGVFLSSATGAWAPEGAAAAGLIEIALAGTAAVAVYLGTLVALRVDEVEVLLVRVRERLLMAWR